MGLPDSQGADRRSDKLMFVALVVCLKPARLKTQASAKAMVMVYWTSMNSRDVWKVLACTSTLPTASYNSASGSSMFTATLTNVDIDIVLTEGEGVCDRFPDGNG